MAASSKAEVLGDDIISPEGPSAKPFKKLWIASSKTKSKSD
jgi:hypothetical protein